MTFAITSDIRSSQEKSRSSDYLEISLPIGITKLELTFKLPAQSNSMRKRLCFGSAITTLHSYVIARASTRIEGKRGLTSLLLATRESDRKLRQFFQATANDTQKHLFELLDDS